ncbi:MAG: sulfur carrier protein ThiS [Candidatus Omnitrophica bacterium]|nr:sulfur carrier protein ThiS [Candidatus Omnitrophota bacterium]
MTLFTMNITLNGKNEQVRDGLSLFKLIELFHLRPERVAVELNKKVIGREEYTSRRVSEGDTIEIVHMVGGGAF